MRIILLLTVFFLVGGTAFAISQELFQKLSAAENVVICDVSEVKKAGETVKVPIMKFLRIKKQEDVTEVELSWKQISTLKKKYLLVGFSGDFPDSKAEFISIPIDSDDLLEFIKFLLAETKVVDR